MLATLVPSYNTAGLTSLALSSGGANPMSLFGNRRTMLLLALMLTAVLACATVLLVAGSAPYLRRQR